jgi:hypothetical protein
VESSPIGILGTRRGDGVAVMLPVHFVVVDRQIFIRTAADSKKARRVRVDHRASFLVESGVTWPELRAVHLTGVASEVAADDPRKADVQRAMDEKYAPSRPSSSSMTQETRAHYARPRVYLRFQPDERIISWDNSRIAVSADELGMDHR